MQITQEQMKRELQRLGPLTNVFLIAEDFEDGGMYAIWHPEIGLRMVIDEDAGLGDAIVDHLRKIGVRRFRNLQELSDALNSEKWEGWDTCSDARRSMATAAEMAKRPKLNIPT